MANPDILYDVAARVSIIGTSGTRDGDRLTAASFDAMVNDAEDAILRQEGRKKDEVVLVSGGSSWADHVAVRLFLQGGWRGLVLFLPCQVVSSNEFDPKSACGVLLNRLHGQFGRTLGRSTIAEIVDAGHRGAQMVIQMGFVVRNQMVSRSPLLLAFTTEPGKQPQQGGTAQTWRMALASKRIHLPIKNLV